MKINKYSASQIDTFLSCRKKYYYSKILNIQPVERPEALDFGSAVHCGLASILRSIANTEEGDRESDRAINAREIAREYALQAVREYCEEYALGDESECKAIALIDSYIDLYFLEDLRNFDVLCVETYFDVPFAKSNDDTESHLHGYFDAIIKNRHDDKIYVIEHKTTGMLNDSYLDRAKIDWQLMIYILACTTVYGRCDGVIYDVISKPKHSMSLGETDEEFEERKAASKTGRVKRKEAETKEQFISRMQMSFREESFVRDIIAKPREIGIKMIELSYILNDMRKTDDPIKYYKCTGNCLKFGACPYMDLCGGKVTVDNLGDKYINCNEDNSNE